MQAKLPITDKRRRQAALLRLIRTRVVADQAALVRMLQQRGFSATQASVSRDLRELGMVKAAGRYVPATGIPAAPPPPAEPPQMELIISAQPVGANLIVVRTPPGAASTVAVRLDRSGSPDIVGTLAGDDTIFIAVRSRSHQGAVLAMLKGLTREEPVGP